MKTISLGVRQPGVWLGMLSELRTLGPALGHPLRLCRSCRYSSEAKYLEGHPLNECPRGLCVNNLLPLVIFTA